MSESSRAIDTIIEYVIRAISEKVKNLNYDKTVFGRITQVIDAKHYRAEYAGGDYSIFSPNETSYAVGDIVAMTFMEGRSNNIVITNSGGGGGGPTNEYSFSYHNSVSEFPVVGDVNNLYIIKTAGQEAIYGWSIVTGKYFMISNIFNGVSWGTF